jgi:GTP-binding protein EngB required for normal cell division
MANTKHRIFKIPILNQHDFKLDEKVEQSINDFLADPNCVYVNHSITVLSNTVDEYDTPKLMNRFVLISLIYKDLNETAYKIDKVSTKIQKVVRKSFEEQTEVVSPNIETEFEKKMKAIKPVDTQKPLPDILKEAIEKREKGLLTEKEFADISSNVIKTSP